MEYETLTSCNLNAAGRKLLILCAISGGLALVAGCQAIAAPFLMWGPEPTKTIPAESTELVGSRTCIIVWAEMDTLFTFPHLQYEVAEHVAESLKSTVKDIIITPTRAVIDRQRRDPDWERTPPSRLAEQFAATHALMIEVTRHTTREPDSPHLFRGRLSANIKVYPAGSDRLDPVYRGEVETVYPESTIAEWGVDEASVRRETLAAFAVQVARKFHEYKVKVR